MFWSSSRRSIGDERGFFFESFNQKRFEEAIGRKTQFVQDNHSRSVKGVLRGLHYQIEQPQGKLVRVVAGRNFRRGGRFAPAFADLRKMERHGIVGGKQEADVGAGRFRARLRGAERDGGSSLQGHRLLRAAARAFAALERPQRSR